MAKVINQINVGSDTYNIASTAYATCTVNAGTQSKVAYIQGTSASDGFTLTPGVTVHVKFSNSNTVANPALNVNGTGDIAIKHYGTTSVGTTAETSWQAGAVVAFTYVEEGTSKSWIMNTGVDTNAKLSVTTASQDIYLMGYTATSGTATTAYTKSSLKLTYSDGYLESTGFRATSDRRLKENIKEFTPQKSVLDLPVVEFDFKDTKKHTIGCIAQDLQEICPEIVSADSNGILSIEESKVVYLLLDEVKKLRAEVDQLKNKTGGNN